jgi:hypothetical protein
MYIYIYVLVLLFMCPDTTMWHVEEELYHWRMAEQWVSVLGMCADMEVFHLLLEEQGDGPSSGTLHCDLRRCVREYYYVCPHTIMYVSS